MPYYSIMHTVFAKTTLHREMIFEIFQSWYKMLLVFYFLSPHLVEPRSSGMRVQLHRHKEERKKEKQTLNQIQDPLNVWTNIILLLVLNYISIKSSDINDKCLLLYCHKLSNIPVTKPPSFMFKVLVGQLIYTWIEADRHNSYIRIIGVHLQAASLPSPLKMT